MLSLMDLRLMAIHQVWLAISLASNQQYSAAISRILKNSYCVLNTKLLVLENYFKNSFKLFKTLSIVQ